MSARLRWGILGTGNIARQFAAGLAACERGTLVAVGSRQRASAEALARTAGNSVARGSYDDVLRNRDVDAVYIALPNSAHHEWTLAALRAGKHVLCEKPLAATAGQAQEMFDAARRAGRRLVEAFMYRSHPQTRAALAAIRDGAIGAVRLIRTSFCFRTAKVDGNIRFDPKLAGGAVMDVGCYCVSFARLVAGCEPVAIHAVGHLHESGVDDFAAGTLTFPGGAIATFTCGMTVQANNTAHVCGTEGYVEIPVPWKPAVEGSRLSIVRQTPPLMDGNARPATPPRETVEVPGGKNLYAYEADDFAAAALDGAAPAVTEQDTLGNMRVLDEIRRQIGLPY
jgi:D-xylose 1-dehydrogenase (NADP+, D-xylono-1,5-lactone-forming)